MRRRFGIGRPISREVTCLDPEIHRFSWHSGLLKVVREDFGLGSDSFRKPVLKGLGGASVQLLPPAAQQCAVRSVLDEGRA
jgi:hypothetical protein